jgi:hypothetical protein
VEQRPLILGSAVIEGRFGELTAIMGGDEERARGVVEQSLSVLESTDIEGRFGVLTAIIGGDEERERRGACLSRICKQCSAVL